VFIVVAEGVAEGVVEVVVETMEPLFEVAMIFIDCCKYNNRPVGRAYY